VLVELHIQDLALIERAELTFGAGLNVITGETGAGKSLMIDALELLLGQRGRAALVRRGAEQARVEGRFLLALDGYGARVAEWLKQHLPETLEQQDDPDAQAELELILTRTVGRDGRSRAHVNHRPVTQRILRELTTRLVEIHGQNDHQKLFDPGEQRRLLDTFGGLEDNLTGYRERRARWSALAQQLEDFDRGEAERLQRLDLLRFQVGELDAADPPAADELAVLLAEREVLRNAGQLSTRLGALVEELVAGDSAALDVVRRAERELEDWEQRVKALAAPAAALREASAHLEEATGALVSFVDGVEADPTRLEELEGRLGELDRLAHKYHVQVADLARRRGDLTAELELAEGGSADREELEGEVARAREAAKTSATRLSKARARLRGKLRKAVEGGLADLGLERATFEVELAPVADGLGPSGAETVEFLLAANPGERVGPLREVASGGEAARILLALRGALAVRQSTPTLIFDEVDAGVGGRLGPRVGAHLAALARHHQIFCVTHLPAIAAGADRHLRVVKDVQGGRTRTQVARLTGDARVAEIADMIAGGGDEETALAEARRLLGQA
jgi:DNA repair protein RecN (Recombination protein N)